MKIRKSVHTANSSGWIKSGWIKVATLSAAVALASCSSTPEPSSELQALQSRYQMISSHQYASQEAGEELREVREALEKGSEAWREDEEDAYEHYVFTAGQTLDIAEERIGLHVTNQQITAASDRRDELILSSRERELQRKEQMLTERESELARTEQQLAERNQELMEVEQRAQKLASELDEVQAKFDERGTVLVLSDILFDFDSAELRMSSDTTIGKIAGFLNEQENREITIEGHTDSVGSESYNEMLSLDRAESVRDALVDEGVPANRMQLAGKGEEAPVASNDTESGRQMNRRVEIVIDDQQLTASN